MRGSGVPFVNKPGESKWTPPCPFHLLTGLYCPGCGTTRALYAMLHLDFYQAIQCNLLSVFFTPFLLYTLVAYSVNIYSGKHLLPPVGWFQKVGYSLVVVVVLFWILRNIPIQPFCWLAPIELA